MRLRFAFGPKTKPISAAHAPGSTVTDASSGCSTEQTPPQNRTVTELAPRPALTLSAPVSTHPRRELRELYTAADAQAQFMRTNKQAITQGNSSVLADVVLHGQATARALNKITHAVDALTPAAANQRYVVKHLGAELLLNMVVDSNPQSSHQSDHPSHKTPHRLQACVIAALDQTRWPHTGLTRRHNLADVQYHKQLTRRQGTVSPARMETELGAQWSVRFMAYSAELVKRHNGMTTIDATPVHESVHKAQFGLGRRVDERERYQSIIAPPELTSTWAGHLRSGSLEAGASLPLWRNRHLMRDKTSDVAHLAYLNMPLEIQALSEEAVVTTLLAQGRNDEVTSYLPMAALADVSTLIIAALEDLNLQPAAAQQISSKYEPDLAFNAADHGAALQQLGHIIHELGLLHQAAGSVAWSERRQSKLAQHIGTWPPCLKPSRPTQQLKSVVNMLQSFNQQLKLEAGLQLCSVSPPAQPAGKATSAAQTTQQWIQAKRSPFERLAQLSPHRSLSAPAASVNEIRESIEKLLKKSRFIQKTQALHDQFLTGNTPSVQNVKSAITALVAGMLGIATADVPDIQVDLFEGSEILPHDPRYTVSGYQKRKSTFIPDAGQILVPIHLLKNSERIAGRLAKLAVQVAAHIYEVREAKEPAQVADTAYLRAIKSIPALTVKALGLDVLMVASQTGSGWRQMYGHAFYAGHTLPVNHPTAADEWHQVHRGQVKAIAQNASLPIAERHEANAIYHQVELMRMARPLIALQRAVGMAAQEQFNATQRSWNH
jgi:hypothetical protein